VRLKVAKADGIASMTQSGETNMLETKSRVCKATIRSIMSYATETGYIENKAPRDGRNESIRSQEKHCWIK